jgi:hypothetical protein
VAEGIEGTAVVTRRRVVLVAIVAAAALAAALVATFGGRAAQPDSPRRGIGVASALTPRAALFGDTLEARIDAIVDPRVVDPRSLNLKADFGRYAPVGPALVTRSSTGRLTRVVYQLRLQCFTVRCLPGTRKLIFFPEARLTFKHVDGTADSLGIDWLPVEVASRLTLIDLSLLSPIDQPPYHASTTLPKLTYRSSPNLLVGLLAAGAALLLAAAGALVVRFVPARAAAPVAPAPRRVEPLRTLSPLERALHMLERARERGAVPEQRKALEQLAGELRRSGERELSRAATVLAWAERPPGPDATGALAAAVQQRLAKGVNGHHSDA